MVIKDSRTGESFVVDAKRARIRHLCRRVRGWVDAIKPIAANTREFEMKGLGLTIEDENVWNPRMISEYLYALRKILGDRLVAYAWCAELQERGAVHYHVILLLKRGTFVPFPDSSGMWVWGSSHITWDVHSPFYIISYLKKENYQKLGEFPKGLRMFHVWIEEGAVDKIAFCKFWLTTLPAWLEKEVLDHFRKYGSFYIPRRLKMGGWKVGSVAIKSPFEVVSYSSERVKDELYDAD